MDRAVPTRLTPAEGRRFGLVVGAAFLGLGTLAWWRGAAAAPAVLWAIGGALVAGGAVAPGALGPVYRAWMGLAHHLSRFTTPIIMSLVYFLVVTPIGLIRRASGHRALVRRRADSFWVPRPPGARRGDLRRQF